MHIEPYQWTAGFGPLAGEFVAHSLISVGFFKCRPPKTSNASESTRIFGDIQHGFVMILQRAAI